MVEQAQAALAMRAGRRVVAALHLPNEREHRGGVAAEGREGDAEEAAHLGHRQRRGIFPPTGTAAG